MTMTMTMTMTDYDYVYESMTLWLDDFMTLIQFLLLWPWICYDSDYTNCILYTVFLYLYTDTVYRIPILQVTKDLDNGGISQTDIVHYCVQGGAGSRCCQSREEALEKTQAAYERVFGGGFEAPLLYRFKHTVPANHFMQDETAETQIGFVNIYSLAQKILCCVLQLCALTGVSKCLLC